MTGTGTMRVNSARREELAPQAEADVPEEALEDVSGGTPSIPIPPPRPRARW